MLWGRAAWGIWWTWDARLTSMLLLWLLYVSYLMLRKLSSTGQTHTLAAVLSIFAAIDVPIVYMSIRLVADAAPGTRVWRRGRFRAGQVDVSGFPLEHLGLDHVGRLPADASAMHWSAGARTMNRTPHYRPLSPLEIAQ